MKKNINFSIIIPTYNSQTTIKETIQSVLKQTYKNYEVIIIDNKSSDATVQILKSFHNPKIKIFNINNNGIIAKSRNYGIKQSNYEWVCFLDSDDIWLENKLECINALVLDKMNLDIIGHKEFINFEKKGVMKKIKYNYDNKKEFIENILNSNFLSPSAVSINKNSLILNNLFFSENKNFNTAEDYHFWINLALSNFKIFFLDKYLGIYTINNNNNSSNKLIHYNSILNVMVSILDKVDMLFKKKINFEINILKAKINYYEKKYLRSLFILFKSILINKEILQKTKIYFLNKVL